MNMDQAQQTFIEESRDLLAAMEDALLTLETEPHDADATNAVFRAMHTIKGAAGIFGLEPIVAFTHVAESVMDRVRDGEIAVDERLIALLLGCQDHIATLLDGVVTGQDAVDPDLLTAGDGLTGGLRGYLTESSPATAGPPVPAHGGKTRPVPVTAAEASAGAPVSNDAWHVSVRFDRELLRPRLRRALLRALPRYPRRSAARRGYRRCHSRGG